MSQHCPGCTGRITMTDHPNDLTWVQSTSPCPGVECKATMSEPQIFNRVACEVCAKKDAELAEIKSTYARIVSEQCAPDETHCTCVPSLRAEIARLTKELATVLENSATWRELYEKYARLHGRQCSEIDRLRALVEVGREMLSASWPFELERVRAKWRTMEGDG